ncbi:hypothetical protein BKE38_29810 [Pseudoroseomonas deserti]|uniref:Uncharacterized protein n=1 Tax=Teichococcus deserti TaxID=1817963 RepID=A0A1V2GTF7_9PROT|nr:hypothetical protein [Pseudoroseomonas deserti]ONG41976.1 hypothetical protein BKE38_29810 [Pseudoroseomonas deserti]
MTPEQLAAIAAANAEQVKRAQQAAPQPPGTLQALGDGAVQLETADRLVQLAGDVGELVLDGLRATGSCVSAVCDLFPSLD